MRLKVMPDYGCFPLWQDGSPTRDIDPSLLPLTPGLAADLLEWSDYFDSKLNWDDPASTHWTTQEAVAFNAQGRLLTQKIADELGPNYQVRYVEIISEI